MDARVKNKGNSGKFLDALINQLSLKNDAALSRALGVQPPVISKIRNGKLPVGDSLILRIHRLHGMPVAEIDQLLAA